MLVNFKYLSIILNMQLTDLIQALPKASFLEQYRKNKLSAIYAAFQYGKRPLQTSDDIQMAAGVFMYIFLVLDFF